MKYFVIIYVVYYLYDENMLRFKLKEMIAKREFAADRRITIGEIAERVGVHRMTLSKMINQRGYNTGTENLDRLCAYFECEIEALVEYIADDAVGK
jgi:DNA-binding Xre family transcriptional regulator